MAYDVSSQHEIAAASRFQLWRRSIGPTNTTFHTASRHILASPSRCRRATAVLTIYRYRISTIQLGAALRRQTFVAHGGVLIDAQHLSALAEYERHLGSILVVWASNTAQDIVVAGT